MKTLTIMEDGSVQLQELIKTPVTKIKIPRKEVIARNQRRNKVLNELRTLIDNKPPQEPFTFKLSGCEYQIKGGNFNAVEFYNKIERLSVEYF